MKDFDTGDRASILRRIIDRVLHGPGHLDPAVRQAAARGEASGPLGAYVQKVALHAYRVTDEDIDALRAAGHSEDQIFEITVSTALGQGLRRRERTLAALRGETCD